MRLFGDLLPYENALKTLLDNISPLTRVEKINLDNALGRVLAEDIAASYNIPPFDRSGVDGYAVRAADTYPASPGNPVQLALAEVVYAGAQGAKTVSAGECVQIATGAKMPRGADAVVMVEDTRREADRVFIMKPAQAGDNVGRTGDDVMKGELLVASGAVLDASKIGVLASQGIRRVEVYAKPVVAILPTGEEIIPPGKPLKGSQIYDINSHTLAAMVRQNGGEPLVLPITGDQPQALEAALEKAIEGDLALTSGGSSVGEKDLLMDILEARGKVFFHGIKIKPGKPTTFSVVKVKPVLGMPGNPTTCLMAAYLFLAPALRKLGHLPPPNPRKVTARMAERIAGSKERTQFLTVRLEGDKAVAVFKESSAITSMSRAEGYVVLPENAVVEKGGRVEVVFF